MRAVACDGVRAVACDVKNILFDRGYSNSEEVVIISIAVTFQISTVCKYTICRQDVMTSIVMRYSYESYEL